MFKSTKTYGHNLGLSAAFRQHRAESHCRLIHGYALEIHLEFEAEKLDHNNWVVDFGNLKSLKLLLEDQFDHKLLVAQDDPLLSRLIELEQMGFAEIRIVKATGCEAFAKIIYDMADVWLVRQGYYPRVSLNHVTVREHGANSATYQP